MLEKSVENSIKDYLFSKNAYFFKVHGSKFMLPGIPDIVCCYKGKFIGIEVKAPGKLYNQSDYQVIHMDNIRKAGGIYLLTDNLQDVIDLLEDIDKCQNG